MREIEWTATALNDMAALDKSIVRRVKQSVERFAGTGEGDVQRLQGINPPEFASVSATTASVSTSTTRSFASSVSAIAKKLIGELHASCSQGVPGSRIGTLLSVP